MANSWIPVIFSQIIFGLAQEIVSFPIRPDDLDFFWFLQGFEHFYLVEQIVNVNSFSRKRTMFGVAAVLIKRT